ncbi:MAG TPA: YqgE/AlgH family protein [Hyphomicrobiaceae bacterium]|jgi:putative transcriptional regulator|nr:YqgE/AlgH family protein [Hyphomicrobiaceae bacterium]
MTASSKSRKGGYLDGQLLVAMPSMSDRRFARSVIYVCAHSAQGAMGLIVNQRAPHISFSELLGQLSIEGDDEPAGGNQPLELIDVDVHVGGPVETGRGFVLHSSDYFAADSTLTIDAEVSLTATIDILKAIAGGKGPSRAMLALGYAGWRPGQLEDEIQANGWLHCPSDLDLLFDRNLDQKYERALSKIGIDPSHLVSEAGHA